MIKRIVAEKIIVTSGVRHGKSKNSNQKIRRVGG